jgi:ABC-type transporter Mla MlaB component
MDKTLPAPGAELDALALPPELTIYTVGELHPQWCRWLADSAAADPARPRSVHAAALEQLDGAGLQMLLALSHAAAAAGCTLQLHAPSAVLQSACATLGLAGWLAQRTAVAEVR